MMMFETEGSCPRCGTAMQDYAKNLICDYSVTAFLIASTFVIGTASMFGEEGNMNYLT